MPSAEEIQQYLTGAWRMMLGKADGLRLLDLSADGFWNSFFAIVIALPALIVGWVGVANDLGAASRFRRPAVDRCLRLAMIDFARLGRCRWWRLPPSPSRPASPTASSHYVVASNWGSALIAWLMLPPPLLAAVRARRR